MATATLLDRRTFLKVSAAAGGGLIIGGYVPERAGLLTTVEGAGLFQPNVWVKIGGDDTVTIMLSQLTPIGLPIAPARKCSSSMAALPIIGS